ncbi:MAG: hypothetical protein KKA62_02650 [Nanoarchaeota archaeon]|nr:hypothetical protein [Nanoarchaeota archaeon]MBU1644538.1 hypothetical protein [Nanoarchaeota archaeon]MBU1976831.1 hypothetical protein [Nanoarchaeota archaeon]
MVKNNLFTMIAATAVGIAAMSGCAKGASEDTVPDEEVASVLECKIRAEANGVMKNNITVFEVDGIKTGIYALNFLEDPNRVTLSYNNSNDDYGSFEVEQEDVVKLHDGSRLYVGEIDLVSNWAFIYLAGAGVLTKEANLTATGNNLIESEEVVFNSNNLSRKYEVSLFAEGVKITDGKTGPGVVVSRDDYESINTSPSLYAKGVGVVEYESGADGILIHKFKSGPDYTSTVVRFFEDIVKCEKKELI